MKRSLAASSSRNDSNGGVVASSSSSGEDEAEEQVLSTKVLAAASSSKPAPTPIPATSTSPDARKKPKLASIFQPRSAKSSLASTSVAEETTTELSISSSQVRWLDTPSPGLLHGVFGDPSPSSKVAFFDLDGTIVRPKAGVFPSSRDEYDFKFLYPSIISKIQTQRAAGFAIVIISNQKQTASTPKTTLPTWKKKMGHICRALDVPVRILAALGDDEYRKPRLGMYNEFQNKWNSGCEVNKKESFYVGDAAGRKRVGDHNDTDLKWALNADLPFFTPEEYFLERKKDWSVPAKLWLASSGSDATQPKLNVGLMDGTTEQQKDMMVEVTPSHPPPIIDTQGAQPEMVLFVGAPASGKTSFYRKFFAPYHHYVHVNQDVLRSRDKCLKVTENTILDGRSVVVDNTNRDRITRKYYIDLANKLDVRIRCFYFDVDKSVCEQNNFVRAYAGLVSNPPDGDGDGDEEKRSLLPPSAIAKWFKDVQVPQQQEGFSDKVYRVTWNFDGDVERRRLWEMYYH